MFSPPNPAAYHALVYEIVRQVPAGRVTTYGFIARLIPPPAELDPLQYERVSPRWVGTAMAACPDDVPWHRVINAQGGISVRAGGEGHLLQRALLEAEGLVFDERGRVDLKTRAWAGPSVEWSRAHGLLVPPDSPEAPTQPALL